MKEIPLTHGYVALVDDEDYDLVSQFKWRVKIRRRVYTVSYYATRDLPGSHTVHPTQYMHRLIMGEEGPRIDHKDGNGLNNQRSNMRRATALQNLANSKKDPRATSRFKGVHLTKPTSKWKRICWKAAIKVNGKTVCLGYFDLDNEWGAAQAYNVAATAAWGEFAFLNTPDMAKLEDGGS